MINLKHPLNAQIELTEACNHQCFYCYNSWQVNKIKNAYMTIQNSDKIIDKIHYEIKPFSVTLTGGEPFLNMGVLQNFVKKLDKNIGIGVNTNLSQSTPKNLETLLEFKKKFGLLVSLPHFLKEKYEFINGAKDLDYFYSNLNFIKNNTSIPLAVNMVVSKFNLDSIYEEGEFLYKRYGVSKFAATPVSNPPIEFNNNYSLESNDLILLFNQLNKLKENFGIQIDSIQTIPLCFIPEKIIMESMSLFKRPCTTGKTTIAIDYKGNVRSCIQFPFSSGNILEEEFNDIWERFEDFRTGVYLPIECFDCDVVKLCNGGCKFNGFKKGESLNRKDPRMINSIKLKNKISPNNSEIDLDKKYILSDTIKYREEKKEKYTFFNSGSLLFVNKDLKNFILTLKKLDYFNPKEILDNYEDNILKKKLETIFKNLISKNFLKYFN